MSEESLNGLNDEQQVKHFFQFISVDKINKTVQDWRQDIKHNVCTNEPITAIIEKYKIRYIVYIKRHLPTVDIKKQVYGQTEKEDLESKFKKTPQLKMNTKPS